MQDPNGWETLGKLLSNPELIAQFTGAGGSEMGEVFGSALGQAKKESEQSKTDFCRTFRTNVSSIQCRMIKWTKSTLFSFFLPVWREREIKERKIRPQNYAARDIE